MTIGIRRVKGNSMLPTYKNGSLIFVSNLLKPSVGRIVIAKLANKEVIKRVKSVSPDRRFYIVGDNPSDSTDSREYGPVSRKDIIGVVLFSR